MTRGKRLGVLVLLMTTFMVFNLAQTCSAYTDWVNISIDHAYYHDLDNDGTANDVRIDFTCAILQGTTSPSKSEYWVYLTLPSGLTYYVIITIYGRYRVLSMTLLLYDTANESGWYNVQIDGHAYGAVYGYSTASYDFDPPTGSGAGEPHATLIVW